MIAHRASTFVLTVKGDSMLAAEILGDDMLVVDRAIEPKHNQKFRRFRQLQIHGRAVN